MRRRPTGLAGRAYWPPDAKLRRSAVVGLFAVLGEIEARAFVLLGRTQADDRLDDEGDSGAASGDPNDAPPKRAWPDEGNLQSPDLVLAMPRAFEVPAKGDVDYQRFVIPTGFDTDRWVQAVEVRPEARAAVHHVVVYIRDHAVSVRPEAGQSRPASNQPVLAAQIVRKD